ncbi:hypothetical protein ACXO1G_07220, partial [Lactobacillus delbrueckii subsp. bulgaricus]
GDALPTELNWQFINSFIIANNLLLSKKFSPIFAKNLSPSDRFLSPYFSIMVISLIRMTPS